MALTFSRGSKKKYKTYPDSTFQVGITLEHKEKGAERVLQKVLDTVNKEVDKKIKVYDDAMEDLDKKIAKYKVDVEKLMKAGKLTEAQAVTKEMIVLKDRVAKVLETYAPNVEKDLAKVVQDHVDAEKKAHAELRAAETKIIVVASLKIGAAVIGAGAGIGTAVVSAGGAAPVALAAVGGAIKVISTAVASLKELSSGEEDIRGKIKATWVQVKADIDKAKLKELKPDKGTMDKIKAFFKTNNAKKMADLLVTHEQKITKLDKAADELGAKIGDMWKKVDAMSKDITNAKKKEAAEKLTKKVMYYHEKIGLYNKNIDYAKAWNIKKKKQLDEVASSGDLKKLGGGDLIEGLQEMKEHAEPFMEAGSALKELLEAVIK